MFNNVKNNWNLINFGLKNPDSFRTDFATVSEQPMPLMGKEMILNGSNPYALKDGSMGKPLRDLGVLL